MYTCNVKPLNFIWFLVLFLQVKSWEQWNHTSWEFWTLCSATETTNRGSTQLNLGHIVFLMVHWVILSNTLQSRKGWSQTTARTSASLAPSLDWKWQASFGKFTKKIIYFDREGVPGKYPKPTRLPTLNNGAENKVAKEAKIRDGRIGLIPCSGSDLSLLLHHRLKRNTSYTQESGEALPWKFRFMHFSNQKQFWATIHWRAAGRPSGNRREGGFQRGLSLVSHRTLNCKVQAMKVLGRTIILSKSEYAINWV